MNLFVQAIAAVILLLPCQNRSVADIIVSFAALNPNPLVAGSTGTIDVLIHSNASDVLDVFLVDILLTPTGGSPVGGLQFSNTQTDAQLTDANYVFFGKSLSENTGANIGSSSSPFDTFSAFDASDDGSATPLAGNPMPVTLTGLDQLLFRLNLNAISAGTYDIDLQLSSAFASDQLDPMASLVSYSSTPLSLSVAASAAVPESGTFGLLAVVATGTLVRRFRRRSRTSAT